MIGQDYFKVELESRSPSVETQVRAFEGKEPMPFIAKDLNGVEHNLIGYIGKPVILWFWSKDNAQSIKHIAALNRIHKDFGHKIQLISLAKESKKTLSDNISDINASFPIIPNSKMLAEGPYGGDLGYPRMFVIGKFGKVKWVFPESSIDDGFDTYQIVKSMLSELSL